MQFTDLLSTVNHLTTNEEVAVYFKALRQDRIIWEGIQQFICEPSNLEALINNSGKLDAAVISLMTVDPSIVPTQFPKITFKQDVLERMMFEFEAYIESGKTIISFDQAALLAFALIEKRKITSQWKNVILEILSRMKVNQPEKFEQYWKSVFSITLQLAEDRDELLTDLLSLQQKDLGLGIALHAILCLPIPDSDKVDLLVSHLLSISTPSQALALRRLKETSTYEIVMNVSKRLFEKYSKIDVRAQSYDSHWANPSSSLQFALQCQSASDIATFAGDDEAALRLIEKSLEILSSIETIGKIKKVFLQSEDASESINSQFSEDELIRPEINTELAYAFSTDTISGSDDQSVPPIKILYQSRGMINAGNPEMAGSDLSNVIDRLSDAELEDFLIAGPKFNQAWDASEALEILVKANLDKEACRVAEILLHRNPVDPRINNMAARAFEKTGNHEAALTSWQTLAALNPESLEIKRSLGKSFLEAGNKAQAFEVMNSLVYGVDDPSVADMVETADIALELGKVDQVLKITDKVLENAPEHSEALTLAGLALIKQGKNEQAIEKITKAIEIPGEDSRAWIALSGLHEANGNPDKSLSTLKEGMAAVPDSSAIKAAYANAMMKNGMTAEAYPLLRELSEKTVDREMDILLLDAMRKLGKEEIGIELDEMRKRYPEDAVIQAEFGQHLVENGRFVEGIAILRGVKEILIEKPEWALAYIEGLLGNDFSHLTTEKKYSGKETREAVRWVNFVCDAQPENIKAEIMKGELLLCMSKYEQAFDLFSQVLEDAKMLGDQWLARLQADMAKSASLIGKTEVGLALIEEAINKKPEWIGLRQLKTEILLAAKELENAESQFTQTLEICPESLSKSIWATSMWLKLNKSDQANLVIKEAIEKYPESLNLHILETEINKSVDNAEPLNDSLENLNSLVNKSNNPQELIMAAVVFATSENTEAAINALKLGSELNSLEAMINLAALYRLRGENDLSLEILHEIVPINNSVSLFEAEIEFKKRNFDAAYKILDDAVDVKMTEFEIEPAFLPHEWQEILNSTNPLGALYLTFDMKSGRNHESIEKARKWVNSDPQNMEARIYAIETALAFRSEKDFEDFINNLQMSAPEKYSSHIAMLRVERDQDKGIFALSAEEETENVSPDSQIEPTEIVKVRALAAEGQLFSAETALDEILANLPNIYQTTFVQRKGILRNAIKAAMTVNRWKEAVDLYRKYGGEMGENTEMRVLFLKVLVSAIEFFNSVQGLSVETHLPWNALFVASLQDEIEKLTPETDGKDYEYRRWITRGNLALTTSQENIRELAMMKPQVDDAAALMAGLRATDQVKPAYQIAQKYMDNPQVVYQLGLCLAEKDPEKAVAILNHSLTENPDQPLNLRLLSRLFERMGKLPDAAQNLETAINIWPNEPRWHVAAAEILTALGNLDEPINHLQAALEIEPNDTDILCSLGNAYIANEDPESALEYLQTAIQSSPNRADVWEMISDAHQLAGNLDQALEAAEKASMADPFAIRPHLQAGKVNWKKGEVEKALNQVKLAISLNPDDAESYVFLARLLKDRSENLKALETLEKAAHCKTISARTMIDHALLVKEINGSAAARDLLDNFSHRFPENPDLLKLLAEAEEECGDLKKAETAARRALEMHPEASDLHLFLGGLQEKSGNLDQAAHYFSQAIAHDPGDTEGYIKLSRAFVKQREFGRAREVLEEGIRRSPENVDLYLACANMLKEAKDYRGAEAMLRKASQIDPRNLLVHRQLGAVLALNLVHHSQEVSSHL